MRPFTRAAGVLLLLTGLAFGCAARLPPDHTFRPDDWTPVTRIAPGARVEVRYVFGEPPLVHHFEGTFTRADAGVLEITTAQGVQRLLPQRVLRVGVGGRKGWSLELAAVLALAGALVQGTLSAIHEDNDEVASRKTMLAALAGGALGALAGARRGSWRPTVVYSRSGSL